MLIEIFISICYLDKHGMRKSNLGINKKWFPGICFLDLSGLQLRVFHLVPYYVSKCHVWRVPKTFFSDYAFQDDANRRLRPSTSVDSQLTVSAAQSADALGKEQAFASSFLNICVCVFLYVSLLECVCVCVRVYVCVKRETYCVCKREVNSV